MSRSGCVRFQPIVYLCNCKHELVLEILRDLPYLLVKPHLEEGCERWEKGICGHILQLSTSSMKACEDKTDCWCWTLATRSLGCMLTNEI